MANVSLILDRRLSASRIRHYETPRRMRRVQLRIEAGRITLNSFEA